MSDISDLSLPADYMPTVPVATTHEVSIVKLAREIAMDLRELPEILTLHGVSRREFEQLKVNPYFTKVLAAEVQAWQSAVNTHQRVKLKAGAMMEEFLPELYKRMVDPKEDMLKKIKGAELVTKLAGMGLDESKSHDPTDRVTITINLGADNKLQFSKQLPSKVIEHDAADELQQGLFETSVDVSSN